METSSTTKRKRLLFDIECNGLLKQVTKVHCIALMDVDSGELWSYGPNEIEKGLAELYEADTICGHNISIFDLQVLWKLYWWAPRAGTRRMDTLVASRLIHPNIKEQDFKRLGFPSKLIGKHSLEAWGLRLGVPKMDFNGPWDEWTQEMQDYCEGDLRTNFRLLNHLKPWEYPNIPLELEHQAAVICHLMETEGWPFHKQKAQELYVKLVQRRDELEKSLVEKFGSWQEVDKVLVPKRDNARLGYKAGVPVTKYKTLTFNPGSRVHIEKKLKELGWIPEEFTESGRAKLDEDILLRIDLPEARAIVEYLLVQKRLGQIADGDNGWLRLVDSAGKIHGYVNSGGTVTGRATHSNPNISQVPSVRAPYGEECRSLFCVPKGWKLVGADMAGLELRTFAHYMAGFDGGAYGKVVTEGDVHSHNQAMAGLPTRDVAKTFIYALLYGAGDAKIGSIVGGSDKEGKALKQKFFKNLPAYAKLKKAVEQACQKGYLKGLDGRRLHIRSAHSALNTLLQSAGAILCKQWMVSFYDTMLEKGYKHGWDGDFVIVGWIHDELQVAVKEGLEALVGDTLVEQARAAGKPFSFCIPLDSSYSVGNNWAETH